MASTKELREIITAMPKVELHVHLEGSIRPATLLVLAERNGVPTRFRSVEEARAAYSFGDLASFLAVYEEGRDDAVADEPAQVGRSGAAQQRTGVIGDGSPDLGTDDAHG